MFKFLKEKLKKAISKTADDIEEKGEETAPEESKEEKTEKKKTAAEEVKDKEEYPKKEDKKESKEKRKKEITKDKKEKVEEKKPAEDEKEEPEKEAKEELNEEKEKRSFFGKLKQKVTTKKIDEKQFEDLFWNLEIVLLENNIAVDVIEKIKDNLKSELVDKPISRGKIEKTISDTLRETLEDLFDVEKIDILEKAKDKSPLVICFVGINGSGKTTTIAKVAKMLLENDKKVVLAAADTFRAAAIDQLQEHADKLGVKLIKHEYGSDAAAVAFDAVKYAQAKKIDAVLIDTAGRMHSNANLMDEMKKIIRVADPDLKIFVGESITGNDCTEQAKKFNETVGLDGIILSKADIDEKGGAAISVSHVTGKPILYLGTGQEYKDLKEFDPRIIIDSLDMG